MTSKPKYVNMLDESAGFVMGVTHRKIATLLMQRLKPYGISPEQWLVLSCVQEKSGMIQKDIAERTGKDKPSTTRILDVLSSKGLVVKRADPNDRRSFFVYATEKGEDLIRRTADIERQAVKDATAGFSYSEYRMLITLLKRVGDNIDKLPD